MALQKLQFRPGVIRDVTGYTNEGGWRDSNLIRFRLGFPQSIGGWTKYAPNNPFLGTCRSMLNWVTLDGSNLLGMGTNLKFYVEEGGVNYDITPIRDTVTLSNPFTATSGSSVIAVSDVSHGCVDGDFVTFSGAVSLGGNVTAAVLNKEYQITFVSVDAYTITVTVVASGSDTGHGGSSVSAAYQISTGLNTQVGGNGWGAGTWGRGTWGSATTSTAGNSLRLWAQDNYGEDLIFNVRDGGIYYWDANFGLTGRAVALDSLTTDIYTPDIATQVLVSDRDRHVIAFGANYGNGATPDPLIIRFSSQEDPFTWTPSPLNSAGDLRLGSGSKIIRAVETKREIVVFTDTAAYSLQFLGPPYTFGIQQIAAGINVNGYNSFATVDDTVYWMGTNNFYVYAGQTAPLQCPIQDYIFDNYNSAQSDKVCTGVVAEYSEITWFYPSADSEENNLYVTYNYADKVWSFGSMARTAWIDGGIRVYPIAAATDDYLYYQEFGTDDGSTEPVSPLNAYIESSPIDIAEGNNFSFVKRLLPDLSFFNATNNPTVDFILKTQNYPGSNYVSGSDSVVARTATVPVDQYTQVCDIRLRGRSVIVRVESNKVGTRWSLGSPRLEMQADGKR